MGRSRGQCTLDRHLTLSHTVFLVFVTGAWSMSLPRWEVRHPTLQHYRIISGPHGRAHTDVGAGGAGCSET